MNKKTFVSAAIMFASVNVAFAECTAPTGTPIIPDGNVASKDELIAAQGAVKNFQALNLDYLKCIDGKRAELDPEAAETAQQMGEFQALEDAAIAMEEKLADEFNTARKAFMDR